MKFETKPKYLINCIFPRYSEEKKNDIYIQDTPKRRKMGGAWECGGLHVICYSKYLQIMDRSRRVFSNSFDMTKE